MHVNLKEIKQFQTPDGKLFSNRDEATEHYLKLRDNEKEIKWICKINKGDTFGDWFNLYGESVTHIYVLPFQHIMLPHQLYKTDVWEKLNADPDISKVDAVRLNDRNEVVDVIRICERK